MTEPNNRSDLSPLAEARDVLVNPPSVEADAALLPAHCMKKRCPGSGRELVLALNTRVVSINLSSTHSMEEECNLHGRVRARIQKIGG